MEYQAIYPSVWENASRKDEIFSYAEGYKVFLNCCKTERDAVRYIRTLALENGFADAGDENREPLSPGTKLFSCKQNKAMAMLTVGARPISEGLRIICAHIDSPRLDVRPNPVSSDGDLVRFRTHYYGSRSLWRCTDAPSAQAAKRLIFLLAKRRTSPSSIFPTFRSICPPSRSKSRSATAFPART